MPRAPDPETPPSHYHLASEETPTRPTQFAVDKTPNLSPREDREHLSGSSSSYESGTTFDDILEDDEVGDEELADGVFDEEDSAPLVSRRRRYGSDKKEERGLLEVSS
jgi:hypothetical protein